jgi:diguanylate cyclase (GGDEF)-like protein
MRANVEGLAPGQNDPNCLRWLFYADHVCLLWAAVIALINLFPRVFRPIQTALPANWLDMRAALATIALCAAISLFLSEETQPERWQWIGRIFGVLTVAIAGTILLAKIPGSPGIVSRIPDWNQVALREGSLDFSAAAFLLMGVVILLLPAKNKKLGHAADGLTILLSILVLTPVLGSVLAIGGVPREALARLTSLPTMWVLALLFLVVVIRRAEHGALSVFCGYGSGSQIARMLTPLVLFLPVFREMTRARLLRSGWIPQPYAGAIVTSVGLVLGVVLLVFLARYINRMQENIQSLTLRDELTGLRSVRGFYLLAEQAFRYARRMQESFGVLFVDMDNLKIINDRLGHSAGSVSLVETAKLLTSAFRETDILGRVGGDEFVVAGQFKQIELAIAIKRLRDAVIRKNSAAGQRFSISLSMGYAVTEDFAHDTLRSLVAKADEDMYKEKHAKKKLRASMVLSSEVPQQTESLQPG